MINSLGPGMKIDLETGKPILSNRFGGMSGPAVKPIALRCVFDVYEAVEVPIIGVGGVRDYRDVVEFLYAGARAVQVGTAVMYDGLDVFNKINKGLEKFMGFVGFIIGPLVLGVTYAAVVTYRNENNTISEDLPVETSKSEK